MPDEVRHAGPGPLSGVQDPVVARELRNLWGVVTARSGQTGGEGQKWVTVDELNAAKREILGKFPDGYQKPAPGSTGGGLGGGVGAGGVGVDLLPLHNTWTGSNTYTLRSRPNVPTLRVMSYGSGTIVPAAGATIMLETGYQGLVDVRKTSSAGDDAVSGGGNAAIYVQHRIDSTTAAVANVNSGIRVQVETFQRSTHHVNDVVGGYFGLYNHGFNTGGFGVHVDLYHAATGNVVSYGNSVELFREFLDGKVIGFHTRAISDPPYIHDSDYGFLASPQRHGAAVGIKHAFAAGSAYIGALNCDIAFDAAYSTSNLAALRIGVNKKIILNGGAHNVGLFYNPNGRIQFISDIGNTVSIGNDGSLRVRAGKDIELNDGGVSVALCFNPGGAIDLKVNGAQLFQFATSGLFIVNNPTTVGSVGGLVGYWMVNLGGVNRYVPFYQR